MKVPGDFAVVRYNSDGSVDTTFGVNGIVDTPIGTGYDAGYGDIMLQSDGKIILTGYAQMSSNNNHFAAVRYNSDGSLDTSFSSDGKATTDFGGQYDYAVGSELQPDGKIVLAGFTGYATPKDYDIAIARYNTNGSLDTTFDSDGKIVVDLGSNNEGIRGVVFQPDGKIVLAGYSGGDFVMLRYHSDGSLDTTFGSGGYVTTDFGSGDDSGYAVAIQTDGKIVVVGTAYNGTDNDFAIARYLTDGAQSAALQIKDIPSATVVSKIARR